MRALVLEDYGRLHWRELDPPEGEGVLLRVGACGLCGSDLSVYKGTPAMRARWRPPLVLGHEVAGVVEEGPEGWVGQRVAVHPLLSCGACPLCRGGRPNLCPHRRHVGFHLPGGFAERIRLPLGQLFPLPPGTPLWKGALAEPLAVALRALSFLGPLRGGKVLVLGAGSLGGLLAWLLRRAGAEVFLEDLNPSRVRHLVDLGLALPAGEGPGEWEAALDTVGTEASLKRAVKAVAPGGKVVAVGLGALEAPLPLQELVLGERTVQGSYTFTPQDFAEATALTAEVPEGLVARYPMEEAPEVFRALLEGRIPVPKVVLEHKEV